MGRLERKNGTRHQPRPFSITARVSPHSMLSLPLKIIKQSKTITCKNKCESCVLKLFLRCYCDALYQSPFENHLSSTYNQRSSLSNFVSSRLASSGCSLKGQEDHKKCFATDSLTTPCRL